MKRWLAAACCAGLLFPPALADAGKGKEKKRKHKDADVAITVHFSAVQREHAHGYFVKKHGRGKCPPGLAKKGNGCLPPGQVRKRYTVGERLAPSIHIDPLPVELRVKLGDPPSGYRFGLIDGDLVQLAVGTLLVVDAIEGLVE
jgi:hypothetical protein